MLPFIFTITKFNYSAKNELESEHGYLSASALNLHSRMTTRNNHNKMTVEDTEGVQSFCALISLPNSVLCKDS